MSFFLSLIIVFILSASLCWLLVNKIKSIYIIETINSDLRTKQSTHKNKTLRIGGLSIFIAFTSVIFFFVPLEDNSIKYQLLLSALPIFLAGLIEDFTHKVSPVIRLLAAFFSAILAYWLTGYKIVSSGVEMIDLLITINAIGIFLTIILSGGICHALNLIDGINGLASGYSINACIGIAVIAYITNDLDILYISLILLAATSGFFIFNWPYGKIFLGDAGAYTLGHLIIWLIILLTNRNPEISGMAMFLFFFWPIADTFLAITRRKLKKQPTNQPDRMHFHHIVMRILEAQVLFVTTRLRANSLSTVFILPLSAVPILIGVLTWNSPYLAFASLILLSCMFIISYLIILLIARMRILK